MTKWYIADPHVGYKKVAKERGFDNIESHDLKVCFDIIENIEIGDELCIVGDVCSRFADEDDHVYFFELLHRCYNAKNGTYFQKLPFKIDIIQGNHDKCEILQQLIKRGYIESFNSMMEIKIEELADASVVVTHIPVYPEEMTRNTRWKLNVHGHLHDLKIPLDKYLCISYDRIKQPIKERDLIVQALCSSVI